MAPPHPDDLQHTLARRLDRRARQPPQHLPTEGELIEIIGAADCGVSFNESYHPDRAPKYQPAPLDPYRTWADPFSIL